MQRLFSFIAAAVISTIFLPSNTFSQDYDVKKTYWGVAPNDVIESERRLPDHEVTRNGLFQQRYYTRTAKSQWAPIVSQWRYYFKRNKLVKVSYHTKFKETQEQDYAKALKHFSKIYGKAKPVKYNGWRAHKWRKDNRTIVEISMVEKPSVAGYHNYELTFFDASHKK